MIPMNNGPDQSLLFVTMRPYRSLTPRGLWLVVICVGLASLVAATPFVLFGFWPVAGFYGLDVALLALAFRASMNSAAVTEVLAVTPVELHIRRTRPRGLTEEWRFNPVWTRLHAQKHDDFGISKITLSSRGTDLSIGQDLGPDEKQKLFTALSSALNRAKSGPVFSPGHEP